MKRIDSDDISKPKESIQNIDVSDGKNRLIGKSILFGHPYLEPPKPNQLVGERLEIVGVWKLEHRLKLSESIGFIIIGNRANNTTD